MITVKDGDMTTTTGIAVGDQVRVAGTAALAVAAPELAAFVVTGADRATWLNGMLTCDLNGKGPGDAVYGLQVGLKGRIITDVVVLLEPERVLLFVARSAAAAVAELLDRHLMMEDALVEPAFDAFDAWLVHGPRARDVLEAARAAGGSGGVLDRTGLGGAFIASPRGNAAIQGAMRDALARVGGTFGDDAGWEALRIAHRVPRFGADFDQESYPQEAGLEKTAVSFSKGCYLGQEVVCMLELRGHVKRKLVLLLVDGDGDRAATDVPARGTPVTDDGGAPLGEVTSAARSAGEGEERVLALAMVKYAKAKEGGRVKIGTRGAAIA
jgi:folate-binding protein YgfZ